MSASGLVGGGRRQSRVWRDGEDDREGRCSVKVTGGLCAEALGGRLEGLVLMRRGGAGKGLSVIVELLDGRMFRATYAVASGAS